MPVTLQASLMMMLALFLFTTMGICIRLSSAFVPVIEVVFFRNFLAVLIMAPVLIRKGLPSIKMNRKRLFFGRASINFIGMLSGFTAVTLIPLAEMTALSFTGPIFVTMGAALFLSEAIRLRRIMAIAVGFVGALIILRPGLVDVSLGAMLALVSALSIAAATLIVKKMTETEQASAIVFWMVMLQAPIAFVPMLFVWEWPTWEQWFWGFMLGCLSTTAQRLYSRAFTTGDVGSIAPFDFTRLPFVIAIGFVVFSELPDVWTIIGGTVIFAASIFAGQTESRRSRKPDTRSQRRHGTGSTGCRHRSGVPCGLSQARSA